MSTGVDLSGRVVIVTGASRGIGKGLAVGLAGLGASVVCAARQRARDAGRHAGHHPRDRAGDHRRGRHRPRGPCDIGRAEEITALVDATVERFGRLDVLVNNAMAPTSVLFAESSVEQWDESMRVNVRSLYLFARAVVPVMARTGGGSIVNISSAGAEHATTPFMPPGYLFYSVAKAALERFTSALAPEIRSSGVTVNTLRPGAVRTEMTAEEFGPDHDWTGWSTPESVVAPVAMLAAQIDTDFTGRILDVSGFGKTWG